MTPYAVAVCMVTLHLSTSVYPPGSTDVGSVCSTVLVGKTAVKGIAPQEGSAEIERRRIIPLFLAEPLRVEALAGF